MKPREGSGFAGYSDDRFGTASLVWPLTAVRRSETFANGRHAIRSRQSRPSAIGHLNFLGTSNARPPPHRCRGERVPPYVEGECRRYLECGILAHASPARGAACAVTVF